jgi:hypothetical protein
MRGWEGDQTGEGRDNRFSFRMADDERRVLVAQSLGRDQHPYAVKQFGLSVETGNVQRKQFGPRRPRQRVNRPAQALFPPLRRMNVASGSAFVLYSIANRSTRDHLDRVRLPTFLQSAVQKIIAANGSSWSDRRMFCRRKAFWAHDQVTFHSPTTAN